jgi:Flp pilus assembly protein TadG
MLRSWFLRMGRRGSVAVEFALVSVFLLAPLVAGAADFLVILTGQAQLNTALQALDYFAWTNPTAADTTTGTPNTSTVDPGYVLSLINNASMFHLTLATPVIEYYCASSTSGGTPPTSSQLSTTAPTCASGTTEQIYVKYTVTTNVVLPFPVSFPAVGMSFSNPFPLSTTGTVQVQ